VHLLSISHYCDNRDYWEVIIVIQVFPLSHRPSQHGLHSQLNLQQGIVLCCTMADVHVTALHRESGSWTTV